MTVPRRPEHAPTQALTGTSSHATNALVRRGRIDLPHVHSASAGPAPPRTKVHSRTPHFRTAQLSCIIVPVQVRFTRSARKHRIGRAHALHVLNTTEPTITPATTDASERRTWIGPDDRDLELEIVAIVEPDYLLVIHVMPTDLRRRRRNR